MKLFGPKIGQNLRQSKILGPHKLELEQTPSVIKREIHSVE